MNSRAHSVGERSFKINCLRIRTESWRKKSMVLVVLVRGWHAIAPRLGTIEPGDRQKEAEAARARIS